ncbi:UBX4 (YMR067C) [Zygosaccharomyces parabailii]|nr:UBX4 (YMR067C) [Zygosaccharomyces parabailii]
MATVVVCYNFNTFKVKVTLSTVLNDVLSQSLEHFGLSQDNGGKWSLIHGEIPVELDLPWRLMNLPTGIKLQLQQLDSNKSNESKMIKIRVQAPGYNNSVVKQVDVTQNLKQLLQELGKENDWPIQDPEAKLQLFTKTIPLAELTNQTLRSLGVLESVSIRLVLPCTASNDARVNTSQSAEKPFEGKKSEHPETPKKIHQLHQVSAFVPPQNTLASQLREEEVEAHELTVEHARKYQQMVLKQTGGLGGPMLPRRLREQTEAAKKKEIQECVVRIRFPDRNHVEVAFEPEDTMQTVYKVVAGSLVNEELEFTLFQSHPYIALPSDGRKLASDWQFGAKTLLLFDSKKKGPYLKDSVLENARNLTDASDVKLDRSEEARPNHESGDKGKSKMQSTASSRSMTPGKYPKWLKLNKK